MHTRHVPSLSGSSPLLAVHAPEQLEYLVDASASAPEPGCCFVIAGADHLAYRLQRQDNGFLVQRLNARGQVLHTQQLQLFEFLDHPLLEALHAGQLFTTPIPSRRDRARMGSIGS